jgi:hypothetical protein
MTKDEYLQTQTQLTLIAGLVAEMPLAAFISRAESAEAIGPILHPSEYKAAGEQLIAILAIARAARDFQTVVLNQRARTALIKRRIPQPALPLRP